MVFFSSDWDEVDVSYEDALAAMAEAHDSYRPATFLNVLVDMADASNADIVRQFGMSNAKSPTIRALSFDRSGSDSTRGATTLCGQSIPDFDFDYGSAESYARFAKQLEEVALAPTVTVRPHMDIDEHGIEPPSMVRSGKSRRFNASSSATHGSRQSHMGPFAPASVTVEVLTRIRVCKWNRMDGKRI